MNFTIDSIIKEEIKICQLAKPAFRFGCDSVILCYFAKLKSKWRVADVGSGSGVIAAICAKMYGAKVTAIELQEAMFECLKKTIEICALEKEIEAVMGNIEDYKADKRFDAVVCNPPYRKTKTGKVSASKEGQIARFSYEMDLELLAFFCRKNLKHGGKLFFSYDSDMLVDAIEICRKARLEPKRLRFLHPDINSKAKLVFVECVFGGGSEIIIEKPLFQKGPDDIIQEYQNIFRGDW